MEWILVVIAIGIALYLKFGGVDAVTKRNLIKLGLGLFIVVLLLIILLISISNNH